MKRYNWLITIGTIFLLWFSLAFACKNGNDRSGGKTTSYDKDTTRTGSSTERKTVKTQIGVGKPFGARDPETCQATGGSRVPTEAEAIESFKCNFEGEASNYLTLVEDVSVQIGSAHPYDPHFGEFEPNIDTKYLIYPIRGSFKRYKCSPVSDYSQNKGSNCWIDDHPHAEGECYKTEWGDWHCFMLDSNSKTIEENVPPPQ